MRAVALVAIVGACSPASDQPPVDAIAVDTFPCAGYPPRGWDVCMRGGLATITLTGTWTFAGMVMDFGETTMSEYTATATIVATGTGGPWCESDVRVTAPKLSGSSGWDYSDTIVVGGPPRGWALCVFGEDGLLHYGERGTRIVDGREEQLYIEGVLTPVSP